MKWLHRSQVNSPHKGQWRAALIFALICAWRNGWVNNRYTSNLGRHCTHFGVMAILTIHPIACWDFGYVVSHVHRWLIIAEAASSGRTWLYHEFCIVDVRLEIKPLHKTRDTIFGDIESYPFVLCQVFHTMSWNKASYMLKMYRILDWQNTPNIFFFVSCGMPYVNLMEE